MSQTQSAVQHTEGPWTNRWHNGDMVIYAGRNEVARIDTDFRYMQQSLADGCLIAAAPDLLAALQFLMTASGEQLTTAFEQAQAAIAKANSIP